MWQIFTHKTVGVGLHYKSHMLENVTGGFYFLSFSFSKIKWFGMKFCTRQMPICSCLFFFSVELK